MKLGGGIPIGVIILGILHPIYLNPLLRNPTFAVLRGVRAFGFKAVRLGLGFLFSGSRD